MAVQLKNLKRPGAGKGTPPAPIETHNNLEKPAPGKTVPLQVNIDPEIKRQFRVYAAERDIDMSSLFITMWHYYKENHG
ncbi:MAG: hypothetical protein ACRD3O_00065 [Terriglobia bacterium]